MEQQDDNFCPVRLLLLLRPRPLPARSVARESEESSRERINTTTRVICRSTAPLCEAASLHHMQTRLLFTVHTWRPLSCCVSRSLALSSSSFFQPRLVSTLFCSLSTYCDTETGRDTYFLGSVSVEPRPILSLPPVATGNQATASLTSEVNSG